MSGKRVEPFIVEFHRDDLTDEIERELWFDATSKRLHRPNGPAEIEYYDWEGRACRAETFYKQGQIYRANDLPSIVVVDVETNLEILQRWSVAGATGRPGGKPAFILKDLETGVVIREEYWENGDLHREHGPAVIDREHENGAVVKEIFYTRGQEIVPNGKPPPEPL
jgi:hypothetical protein